MFIAALFIIAKHLEQPKCSSTEELNCGVYNGIKLINKNSESLIHITWINFKNIMLKKNLIPNSTECMIPII